MALHSMHLRTAASTPSAISSLAFSSSSSSPPLSPSPSPPRSSSAIPTEHRQCKTSTTPCTAAASAAFLTRWAPSPSSTSHAPRCASWRARNPARESAAGVRARGGEEERWPSRNLRRVTSVGEVAKPGMLRVCAAARGGRGGGGEEAGRGRQWAVGGAALSRGEGRGGLTGRAPRTPVRTPRAR